MKKLVSLLFALALACPTAADAADKYIFDPVHTQVLFSVSHLGFSHSHGRFLKFDGNFTFDEQAPETSSVEVTINTDSLDLGSDEWNAHVKGKDFLNVEKFPQMTFKSAKIEKTGDNTGYLTGDLTLLGVTRPVTLAVTFNGAGIHPYTKNRIAGFSATGMIKRSEFGMTGSLPAVGDEVMLTIEVEGLRQDFENLNNK